MSNGIMKTENRKIELDSIVMLYQNTILAGIYLLKVNNRNTRRWRRSGDFIVNFEHISNLVLVFLLLTLNR